MNGQRFRRAKPDLLTLAPVPDQPRAGADPRGADGPNSVILDQVANGLAGRMAVLRLLCGGPAAG